VKTRLGSLSGEGNLPIETVTALNANGQSAKRLRAAIDGIARANEVIE
jgi:hypothetical protein